MNAEYMCFKQKGAISTLSGQPKKFEDQFTYLGSNISSTESDVNKCLEKVWNTIDWLYIIWKSDLSDKIKCDFFQAVAVSILLYGCTTWTQTRYIEKNPDGNYTRMLHTVLNKFWKQHPTKEQLYGHLLSISQTIQIRWTWHAGHCCRNKDELINDVLLERLLHMDGPVLADQQRLTSALCRHKIQPSIP